MRQSSEERPPAGSRYFPILQQGRDAGCDDPQPFDQSEGDVYGRTRAGSGICRHCSFDPPDNVRKCRRGCLAEELPPNPATDFAVLKGEDLTRNEAQAMLSAAIRKTPDRSVLVFIHGFNNRFEDSVYRLAHSHDAGTHSVPNLVTWPSRGSTFAYGYDRDSTNYTRDALEILFQYLARDPEIKEVSILGHSMGNWLALESLRQMAIRNGGLPPKFKNIMLAAPDVDVDVFRSQIADMGKQRPQFTLFVSQDDRALAVSRRVWGGVARLGID